MKVWHLILIVVALIAAGVYAVALRNAVNAIDQYEAPQSNVTLLEVGTSDKQITVDATEIQGGHYFSR